jgi:glycogen synthase
MLAVADARSQGRGSTAELGGSARATAPAVCHATGGRADTVTPHTEVGGTGFVFDGDTRESALQGLIDTVREAVSLFSESRQRFLDVQWNCFRQRFMWRESARPYQSELYARVLESPRTILATVVQ